jgi:hypothetical protein
MRRSMLASTVGRLFVREAFRASAFSLALCALTLLVGAVSDEGGLSLRVRIARALPATALASGLGALWASSRSRARGEWRTFASLGGAVERLHIAWALGASSIAVVGAALILTGLVATEGFIPVPPKPPTFVASPDVFVSTELGVRVQIPDGALSAVLSASPEVPYRANRTPDSNARNIALYLLATALSLGLIGSVCTVQARSRSSQAVLDESTLRSARSRRWSASCLLRGRCGTNREA